MTVRSTILLAFAGIATAVVVAGFAAAPARALTFENYQGASGGSANGWVDLNYDDPNKKPTRNDNGNKAYQNGNTTLQFGPAGGFSSRNVNPDSYFTPNYLMGK
jgi:hypothetical protein